MAWRDVALVSLLVIIAIGVYLVLAIWLVGGFC